MASELKPLRDYVSLASGNTPSKSNSEYWGGATPWVSAKDMSEFWLEDSEDHLTEAGVAAASRIVPAGTVLMLTRGMTLHNRVPICRIARDATFNQDVKAVLPKDGLYPSFLPYLLTGNHDRLHERVDAAGHGTGRLNTDAILSLPVHVPATPQQISISQLGEALDGRIHNLRQTNATLEAIAQALFKSWFVDFDPVRAKAEGREPGGMDAATASLFPGTLTTSERRTMPEGWKFVEAGTLFDVGIGKTPPRKETHWFSVEDTDVPWVSIRDMGLPGAFVGKTSEYLTEEAVSRFNVRRVPAGTVLLSFKLTVGRIAIADSEMTTNEAIAHFRTNGNSLPQSYLYCYLKSFDMSSLGSTSSIATATNSRAIRALPVLHPGDELAALFDQHASPLLERVRVQQHQIDSLTELRDTLIPRLISGKLRLPEVDAAVTEVTT